MMDPAQLARVRLLPHNLRASTWTQDADDIAALLADYDRLAATAAKLPQTADGLPITPGMTCWGFFADNDDGPEPVTMMCVRPQGKYTGLYSTKESAAAAQAKGASDD